MNKSKRTICVFTGTRAEYGLLYPLMRLLKENKAFDLKLLVSGMHLEKEFGNTYKQIEKDGFEISKKVKISLNSDTPTGICKSIGLAVDRYSKALAEIKPELLLILGDRFEAFAAATASTIMRIPVAHLHGGESTFGLIDEPLRHSITKMSHLHFTSLGEYQKRVIQLGENPKTVFNVGAIGLDNIRQLKLLSKQELEKDIGFKFDKKSILVTYHPVTLEKNTSEKQFNNLLSAISRLSETSIIFTKANSDTSGKIINKMIDDYVEKNKYKAIAFASMGQLRFLSAMKYVDAIVGNSSSGIIEAPSFRTATINIGDRQKGRFQAKSVINCKPMRKEISMAFDRLYSKKFQNIVKEVENPYGKGNTAKKILRILKKYKLKDVLKKNFYNLS